MSHVVNPILFRLKYSNFWSSVCVTNKKFSFFLDSKNTFVIDYLSKIVRKMYFLYGRYNITFFKVSYRSKSINIYFMLKQRRGLSFINRAYLVNYSKKRMKRISCVVMYDFFRQFRLEPAKLKTFEMKKFASNWFEYFNDDLYYDIKWYLRLKVTERFNRVNIRKFVDYKPKVVTKHDKMRRSRLVRVALLDKRRHYILSKIFFDKRREESLGYEFYPGNFTHILKHYFFRFYNKFTAKIEGDIPKDNSLSNFRNFAENIVTSNNLKIRKIDKIFVKYRKLRFRNFVNFLLKDRILKARKRVKKLKKKAKKKRVYMRKEFVLSTTHNLSFMLNKRRRRKYKLVFYGWKLWSRFSNFHKKSKLALYLKDNSEAFKNTHFNILNAKEMEVRRYKIWRLSNNYMKDIKTMYNDLKVLINKNLKNSDLLEAKKLKKSRIKRIVFRKRRRTHKLEKAFVRFRFFPVKSRIRYAFTKRKCFKVKHNRRYFKNLKKKYMYRKTAYYFREKNRLKSFENSRDRFKKAYEFFFKSHNTDWFVFYDQCFLLQRKKWERNFSMGFKFYNTFDYKLPLQYLTFPYMDFLYEWLILFNQFLYERQRRLFPSKSSNYFVRKRIEHLNKKQKYLWEVEKFENLLKIKYNKKFLFHLNFIGFLSQKYRSRKYWRRKKTIYKYLKRWKKHSKLKKKMRYRIKFKRHRMYNKFIYWFKQMHFLMAQCVYIFILKGKIASDLNLMFSFRANFNIYFFIKKPAKKTRINAITVFNYIKRRIFRGAFLFKLLKYVMRKFKKFYYLKIIDGFAIRLSGRFSKRDRAAQYWFKHGKFTKSTRISKIDHYSGKMFLKYSTCSLKISIMRNNYRHRLKKKKDKLKKIKKIKKLSVI